MIHVDAKTEPEQFQNQVRNPGTAFLQRTPHPTTIQFNKHAYWQRALPDLRNLYGKVCSYCAQWIPHGTGNHSVDHFVPKSTSPELAYEWSNYRYVSARFNSRKGNHTILDPFQIDNGVFVIDFVTMLIKPDPTIPDELVQPVKDTIHILKLNTDDDLVQERKEYFDLYKANEISLSYLKEKAPFIAYEMIRQNMI